MQEIRRIVINTKINVEPRKLIIFSIKIIGKIFLFLQLRFYHNRIALSSLRFKECFVYDKNIEKQIPILGSSSIQK